MRIHALRVSRQPEEEGGAPETLFSAASEEDDRLVVEVWGKEDGVHGEVYPYLLVGRKEEEEL